MPGETLPGPFDLRDWHASSPKEARKLIEPLAPRMTTTEPTALRSEDDPVRRGDRFALKAANVKEPCVWRCHLLPKRRRQHRRAGLRVPRLAGHLENSWDALDFTFQRGRVPQASSGMAGSLVACPQCEAGCRGAAARCVNQTCWKAGSGYHGLRWRLGGSRTHESTRNGLPIRTHHPTKGSPGPLG